MKDLTGDALAAGDTVEFKFSERPSADMTHRLHSFYILGPSGTGTFRNRFNYGVGRWIQIHGSHQLQMSNTAEVLDSKPDGSQPTTMEGYLGVWVLPGANAGSLSAIEIAKQNETKLGVHSYGECSVYPCDWGTQSIEFTGAPAERLRRTLSEVKVLEAFLPICAQCKKIRDQQGVWHPLEVYLGHHANTQFSHSYCPECARKIMAEAGLIDE